MSKTKTRLVLNVKRPYVETGSLGSLAKNEWWFTQGAKSRKRRQASPPNTRGICFRLTELSLGTYSMRKKIRFCTTKLCMQVWRGWDADLDDSTDENTVALVNDMVFQHHFVHHRDEDLVL